MYPTPRVLNEQPQALDTPNMATYSGRSVPDFHRSSLFARLPVGKSRHHKRARQLSTPLADVNRDAEFVLPTGERLQKQFR